MNTKSTPKSFWTRAASVMLIAMLLLAVTPAMMAFAAPSAVPAVDGDGIMTVNPTTTVYGTSTTYTFTFTPTPPRDFVAGSSVDLIIPAGWTAPVQLTNVFVNTGTCALNPSWTIVGSTVRIDVDSCLSGQYFTITYTGTPGPVSGSPYTFLTQTNVPGGGGTFSIASSPTISVTKKALTVTGITAADVVYGNGGSGTTLNTASAALVGVEAVDSGNVALTTPLPTTGSFTPPWTVGLKSVTIATLTLSGTASGNYTLTQPAITANITPKPLTISGTTASNKPYDGTTSATVNTVSSALVGNLDGPNVVLVKTGVTGVFTPDGNAGNGKTVQVSGFTISGSAAFNYTLIQPTTAANITPKSLTVTGITASNKTYDTTTAATIDATGASLSGVLAGDVGSVALDTSLAAGAFTPNGNAGTGKTVQISGLTISGSASGNYSVTQPTTTANIDAKALTVTGVTASDKVYDGGTSAVINAVGAALVGNLDGGNVTLNSASGVGTFTPDSNVGAGKTVQVSGLTLSGIASGNYTLTQPTTTASITPKAITVTGVTAGDKVYDGGVSAVVDATGAVMVGNLDGVNVTLNTASASGVFTPDGNVGAGKTVQISGLTISGSASSNYTLTQPTTTASITPKAITVTGVTAGDKTYDGGTTAVVNASGAAMVGNLDGVNVTLNTASASGAFTPDGNVGAGKTVQISGLTISGSASGNYALTQPTTTAGITARPITITAVTDTKIYDGGNTSSGAPTITSGGLAGTDSVTWTQAFDNKNAGTGKTLTPAGVVSDGNGGLNYAYTYTPDTTGVITAKPITVTAVTDTRTYNGTVSSSGVPGISPTLVGTDTAGFTQSFDTKNVGTGKTLTPAGAVNDGNGGLNYAVTPVNNTTGVITVASVNVTANPQTKVYGAADPALTYVPSPALFGTDVFTGSLTRASGETVNTYAISVGTLSAGGNYSVSFTGNNLSITKATLNAKANDKTITFGSPDPVFDITYTGFQFTDTVAALTTAPTCGVTGAHAAIGAYPITCSGGAAANYTFTYTNGTLTVSGVVVATFSDVPTTYWSWSYIEALYAAGITGGCGTNPLIYCPTTPVTRDQMAVFLLRGIHGSAYVPPAVGTDTGFADVPVDFWAAAWIKQLVVEGITVGCGNGNFCPSTPVTRAQMAVFLLRAEHGGSYVPPAVGIDTGFADVPTDYWAAAFIKQLAVEGITGGCGNGNYCPDTVVTRDQMAVFLVRTFNLPLP